jgi:hypothetical protein
MVPFVFMHYWYFDALNCFHYKNKFSNYFPKFHTISHRFLCLPNMLFLPENNLHMNHRSTIHFTIIPRNKFLFKKLTVARLLKKFPVFCRTQTLIAMYSTWEPISSTSILITFSHLHLAHPQGLFFLSFLNNVLHYNVEKRCVLISALTFHIQ